MSDEPNKNALHFLDAHIDVFEDAPVEHPRWHVPTTALLLQFLQAPENDALTMGETVLHIWQIVTRIMVRHVRLLQGIFQLIV